MTDREMLELAAKAAGYYFHGLRVGLDYENCFVSTTNDPDDWIIWDPRGDDGDALRLKVSLHLIVGSYSTYSSVGGTYTTGNYTLPNEITVWHHETAGDACAAERLAITRAAAEIWRQMEEQS